MLKNNFIAAQNAREPLEQLQDIDANNAVDIGADGNAFAGSRANHDDEMHHAVRGAIMNGDTGANSSIANAGMRLAAKFGSAATKSDKDAEKSRAMYMQVMLADLNKRLNDIDDQLDTLGQIQQMMANGSFDPANDAEHLAMLQKIDEDMTLEQWNAMSEQERIDWGVEHAGILNAERDLTEEKIQNIMDPDSEISAQNNKFEDPELEVAAIRVQERTGVEFDRHNITPETREELFKEMYQVREEQIQTSTALDKAVDSSNTKDQEGLDSFLNASLG